jgi:peptidyl-prolyl cis-trans isomerase B (cyclophilin B)
MPKWTAWTAVVVLTAALFGFGSAAAQEAPRVLLTTSAGTIELELFPEKAPETVANFLQYVGDGYYEGTVFHRVIKDFMIQGGGLTPDLKRKSTRGAIQNEAGNGLSNRRGTIAMARTPDPHSATAQFFINTKDNFPLDYKNLPDGQVRSQNDWGYCVFGRVVAGMDVVDRIEGVRTTSKGPFQNVPATPVVIEKAAVLR